MAVLTVQDISRTGLNPSYASAAAGGDSFDNDGRTFVHVKNGSAGSITVTVNSQTACNYGFDHDETVSVPAGGERLIGPFPKERFNDADGRVKLSYSAVTSLTVAAIRL